jgi:hypothetical protein
MSQTTDGYSKLAKVLRADKDFLFKLGRRLSAITGKKGVLDKIAGENEKIVNDRMFSLGAPKDAGAKEVYDALISKIEADDHFFFEALGRPSCSRPEGCQKILEAAKSVADHRLGFFLKEEKAREMLLNEPPRKIMEYLGYSSAEELLAKEDFWEIFCALRLLEDSEWLNGVFLKQYEKLSPEDFEEREVKTLSLSERWVAVGEKFIEKKWHNISHLKELGVIFIVPIPLDISGELLRSLGLTFHYFHEIYFYSEIFRKISMKRESFARNLAALLRGDCFDRRLEESKKKSLWLVIPRYLAKDDENDWRLFVPHLNPEALHWRRAEEDLARFGETYDGSSEEISFWLGLDWVGDFFKDEIGNDTLVSFNLVDAVMSLVKDKEMIKYLYHHQEAMWNKIFEEYFGNEELERRIQDFLLKGYFEI